MFPVRAHSILLESGNSEVRFHRLEEGTHTWYTNPMNLPGQIADNPDFTDSLAMRPQMAFRIEAWFGHSIDFCCHINGRLIRLLNGVHEQPSR